PGRRSFGDRREGGAAAPAGNGGERRGGNFNRDGQRAPRRDDAAPAAPRRRFGDA
ncbi:MAG: hypothetical protein ACTH5V_21035, partial [Serratia proteamaculans]